MKSPTEITVKIIGNLVDNPISKSVLKISEKLFHVEPNNRMPKNGGVPIVLTTSAIEMSDFNLNPFIAFQGASHSEFFQNSS